MFKIKLPELSGFIINLYLSSEKTHCMIQSMTGFGKAQGTVEGKKIIVEIKSVNSKGLDIYTKVAPLYKEKEMVIRKLLSERHHRGKIECSISVDLLEEDSASRINRPLLASYLKELESIEKEHSIEAKDYLSYLLKMPDIYKTERPELDESEWAEVLKIIEEASDKFMEFRMSEGSSINSDFTEQVNTIERLLKEVEKYEGERIEAVKNRIQHNLQEMSESADIDENRLEQELIYYMEKLDIHEEKVRLQKHCDYFRETQEHAESKGKKLGFISQEMGREINTLGSKANHAEIQKLVVQMKDALERIKEQILNVL